jgi:hypothetical protein
MTYKVADKVALIAPMALTRVRVLVLACVFGAVVAGSLAMPATASARWLRADDHANRAYTLAPRSVSTRSFSLKVDCGFKLGTSSHYWRYLSFKGGKRSTALYIAYEHSDGSSYLKRATYTKFRLYTLKHKGMKPAVDVRYAWKRDSHHKKYRYAQYIVATWYAE